MIKAAVLGSPINHSLSPLLHTVAYAELGLESDYSRVEIKSGELKAFLDQCDSSWTGFSLTMPLKEEVLQFTEDATALAKRIKSANTLVQKASRWSATTTDVTGITHALAAHDTDATGDVLIIGGGATARAAAAACDGIATKITIMNRSLSRVADLANAVEVSDLEFISWGDDSAFELADLIISTTPEGATDSLISSFPEKPSGIFFEVLYKPWPTAAVSAWSDNGGQIIDGLDLLIHQAIDQVSIFSGEIVERSSMAALMRRHGLKALASST